ncbi:MAG: DUF3438 family protein [Cycloclasticus sp.]
MRCVSIILILLVFSELSLAAKDAGNYTLQKLEFKQAKVVDAVRIISEMSGANIVTTNEAANKLVTIFLRAVTVQEAVDTICKVTGLWYRKDSKTGVIRVMDAEEYQRDIVVFKNDKTRVFTLQNYNVKSAAQAIENLFGERVELELGNEDESLDQFGGSAGSSGGGNNNDNDSNNDRDSNNERGSEGAGSSAGSGAKIAENLSLSTEMLSAIQQRSSGGSDKISTLELAGFLRQEAPIMITINQLHNLLIVRTSDADALDEIARLIKKIDLKPAQVLLEMKILELSVGDSFKKVFDVDFTSSSTSSGPSSSADRNPLQPGGLLGPNLALGLGNFGLEGGTLLFQAMSDNIRLRLQLLEENNLVNVLATPVLLASNNTQSRLFIGEERILVTGVNTTTTTGSSGVVSNIISAETELRDIGNTLLILPRINKDGTVTLSIQQDSSSVIVGAATIPVTGAGGTVQAFPVDTVNTANLEGAFLAQDGLTVAVGGMIRSTVTNVDQRVPFLSDIPLLGHVFERKVKENKKTELVLLITPHVFASEEEASKRAMQRVSEITSIKGVDKDASFKALPEKRFIEQGEQYEMYLKMSEYAASNIAKPFDKQTQDADYTTIKLVYSGLADVFDGKAIQAKPLASWRKAGLYVTAVKLKNTTKKTMFVDFKNIQGAWLASSVEKANLAKYGLVGDSTYLYLISDKPFDEALAL